MKLHNQIPSPPHYDICVLADLSPAPEGFLQRVSRRVCTVDDQGKRSASLVYDEVDRKSLDAVVIVPHFLVRDDAGIEQRYIVLRSAIRPPVALRDQARSPIVEASNRGLWEVPAGLVEESESGLHGLRVAAARELLEETGFSVAPEALCELGPSTLPAPGVIAERHFFFQVEVDPAQQMIPELDGSPLEEAGQLIALSLDGCLRAARIGKLQDAKTELALRRLIETLDGVLGVGA